MRAGEAEVCLLILMWAGVCHLACSQSTPHSGSHALGEQPVANGGSAIL